ncbi:putative membrane protein [Wickerhamomyces ciferrii]|uniref:Membrane protein n=1 Tax=Wickerhamomyces ciferrii (strain ATCC 14091 / BCRC 22168 / CBS 111 / JCM 3599 / NBRC 0793 / NRRL Y-1031 F-60-10) TaxID=1206466 RepID=K0KLV7_WICCF|nr:uncharacterized protein BN7_1863 [Wickerhamomyces ciferrii]CCH42319.1 putative membrane protein [Wickerhamomyces ciferrii]
MIKMKNYLIILFSIFQLTTAIKFTSCSGIYPPKSNISQPQPFINVTINPKTNQDFNYTTLIFHYKDIENSNIPLLEDFINTDSLKICNEDQIRSRQCREPGKFVVDYQYSDSRIYNEVLNINHRSFLQYDITEKGFYCVYIQSLEDGAPEGLNEIDVKFQQSTGYLSLDYLKVSNVLLQFQLPIVSILLIFIMSRFFYIKTLKKGDVSIIQNSIFHYTYMNYLITFSLFLKLWINNKYDLSGSGYFFLKLISFGLGSITFGLESLTWGLILCLSHGFGTLYDRQTFPKRYSKKIIGFMVLNFLLKLTIIDLKFSNVQVLNFNNITNGLKPIISLIGFIWVIKSFYKTTKEISIYFDLTTSKLYKKSGYIIFFTPIIVTLVMIILLTFHFINQSKNQNLNIVELTETFWDDKTLEYIMAIPSIGDFITISLLIWIWDNVDSQKIDENNVAEYGAPERGELTLDNLKNGSTDELTSLRENTP